MWLAPLSFGQCRSVSEAGSAATHDASWLGVSVKFSRVQPPPPSTGSEARASTSGEEEEELAA